MVTMGFLYWLNPLNWFRSRGNKTPESVTFTSAPAAPAAKKAAPAVKKVVPAAKKAAELRPQCGALAATGAQCKRSAREASKYCGSHKGYRPPAAAVARKAADTKPAVAGAKDTKPSARKAPVKKAADLRPQCGAIAGVHGGQCKNSARDGSKYCGRHKGYRPPAAAVAAKAKDTAPRVAGAKDTKPTSRKAPAKAAAKAPAKARKQVSQGDYKLFQSGNRFFFSKKAQKDVKGTAVYAMPTGRSVVLTPNGLPVLKKN